MQSGETLVMPDNVTIVSTHTGTGGVHESIYDNPYALPGNPNGNAEMQSSWDAIVAGLNGAADAAEDFAERVNSIRVTGPQIAGAVAGALGVTGSIVTPWAGADGFHANGLPWVPYDGYIAALHKGERVVPTNRNMNVYNNTYFDRTTVSGGVDADGLAARIATAQQRALAAVGS